MKFNLFRYRHAYSLTFLKATLASIGVGLTLIYAGIAVGGLYFTSNDWPTGMCLTVIFFLALRDFFKLPGGLLTHSKRVTLYEKGFICSDGKSQDRFLWEDITAVRMIYKYQNWPLGTIRELQGKCQQIHFTGLAIAVSLYSGLYTWRLNAS